MGLDIHLTDTYFVVAHFHYIMVGGAIMAYMGGLHFWWPKMTGKMYNEAGAKASAILVFVGFNLTFFPQFMLGYMGMPRRYHAYPDELQVLNVLSTAGASVLALGYLLPAFYLTYSLFKGKAAPANPWGATGLEWTGAVTAADVQLRRGSGRERTGLQLQAAPRRCTLASLDVTLDRADETTGARPRRVTRTAHGARAQPESAAPLLQHGPAARSVHARDVGVPGHRSHVLRRPVHGLHRLPDDVPGGVGRRAATS